MCLAANCENGTSRCELHSRVVLKGMTVRDATYNELEITSS